MGVCVCVCVCVCVFVWVGGCLGVCVQRMCLWVCVIYMYFLVGYSSFIHWWTSLRKSCRNICSGNDWAWHFQEIDPPSYWYTMLLVLMKQVLRNWKKRFILPVFLNLKYRAYLINYEITFTRISIKTCGRKIAIWSS